MHTYHECQCIYLIPVPYILAASEVAGGEACDGELERWPPWRNVWPRLAAALAYCMAHLTVAALSGVGWVGRFWNRAVDVCVM